MGIRIDDLTDDQRRELLHEFRDQWLEPLYGDSAEARKARSDSAEAYAATRHEAGQYTAGELQDILLEESQQVGAVLPEPEESTLAVTPSDCLVEYALKRTDADIEEQRELAVRLRELAGWMRDEASNLMAPEPADVPEHHEGS